MNNVRTPELISPASYTNWMPFVLVKSSTGFSIAPRPTPVGSIAVTTIVIGIFFVGMAILIHLKSRVEGALGIVLAIGIPTTVATPMLIVFHFRRQQRLGPVLVFDAAQQTFALPRASKKFRVEEIDCLCLVWASQGGEWGSQLQLHSREGGRFLLVAAQTRRELEPMLKEMLAEVRVRGRSYTEDRKAPDGWREGSFNEGSA